MKRMLWGALAVVGCAVSAAAAEPPADALPAEKASYYRDIRPIFQAACQGCHQPAKAGGEYVMTSFERLLQGGESEEAAIVPGQPDASSLLAQITPDGDGQAAMPKGRPPLSAAEIALVRRWIAAGAADDSPMSTRPHFDADHPPAYPSLPVVTSLAFSPDGQLLAVSGYHEVLLYRVDGADTELAGRLVGLSERIEKVAFSPDGSRLAVAGGSPGRFGEIQVWNIENRELLLSRMEGFDTVYGVSWSPNGELLALGCPDHSVRVIEAASGKQVLFNGAHDDWVLDTVFSVQGDHVVTVSRDRSMKLMHLATERFIDNITSITPGALKGGLLAVDRHPTKDELLIGGADGQPKVYQMQRTQARKIGDDFNKLRDFARLPGRVYGVAFSADGQHIVAGGSHEGRGLVRVYNASDSKQISQTELADGGVYAVRFQPSGKLVAAAGFSGVVRLIDVATGDVVHEFPAAPLIDPAAAAAGS